jgi:glycosyltransferase involved in cell wall biosynthesis
MKDTEMLSFSIVACCHNSAERLERTLAHLAAQSYPASLLELIIVDNGSTDNTGKVATALWLTLGRPFSMEIVKEPRLGLSHARKAGVLHSIHDYIVFCDDDNWLAHDYIQIASLVLSANPRIGVLGGSSAPVFQHQEPPNWFFKYADAYAVGVQSISSGEISMRGYVWGAGSIVKAQVLKRFYQDGLSQILSDRTGEVITSGGDSELCKLYLFLDYILWYDERMMFKHYIPSSRLSKEYLNGLLQGHEESHKVLAVYEWYIFRDRARRMARRHPWQWLKAQLVAAVRYDRPVDRSVRTILRSLQKNHLTERVFPSVD